MSDNIMFMIEDDGEATLYDDTYDIVIHCVSKEEQNEAMRQLENVPHWIPVTERLPERGKDVLVTRDYDGRMDCIKSCRYVEAACCYGEDDNAVWSAFSDEYKMIPSMHKVVAWMPLPEPYKGVNT